MKIVFFGDSNTWGYWPETGARNPKRFTRLLAQRHPEWEIVEEGLNGRTLCAHDPYAPPRNGKDEISGAIRTHTPYDVLVVMLGTNDSKRVFNATPRTLEKGLYQFLEQATSPAWFRGTLYKPGRILLVQPPLMNIEGLDRDPWNSFGLAGARMMETAGPIYKKAAEEFGIEFLGQDPNNPVSAGLLDGVHLEDEGHEAMADLLEGKLLELEASLQAESKE